MTYWAVDQRSKEFGKREGRKELAKEILAAIRFYQPKVTAEKCLNDTIEQLEKEIR